MQISPLDFPLQNPSHQGPITPIFKDSNSIPHFNLGVFGSSSHGSSSSVRFPEPEKFSAAKKTFLAELSHYIPVGSFTGPSANADQWLCDSWTETSIYSSGVQHAPEDINLHRLLLHGWIRMFVGRHNTQSESIVTRVYVLPDDMGRRFVGREDKTLRKRLMKLMEHIDVSLESWEGRKPTDQPVEQYRIESTNDDSLFYLFNTLSSPSPASSAVSCSFAKEAMELLLGNLGPIPSLKTELYPHQRRSAALMIKREVEPARNLDPRLEPLQNPLGSTFYYDKISGNLLREKRMYEEPRGGILAETMGFGKTLICLAAISATKGHWPRIPPEFSIGLHPIRPRVGTLKQMAASAVGRAQIPWRAHFQDLESKGEHHTASLALLEENVGSYVIPIPEAKRERRARFASAGTRIRLCSATLVIVPSNLLIQWKNEISLHFEKDSLQTFSLDTDDIAMPNAMDLLRYDIILMTKQRFEREMTGKGNKQTPPKEKDGCTCPYNDGCRCSTPAPYRSPLLDLHFLRIIVDEGHDFASLGGKRNVVWALQNLHVERRWVVSGTPASGLLGVEVGVAAQETFSEGQSNDHVANQAVLQARRCEKSRMQEVKDLEGLGRIVIDFLNLRPWANLRGGEDPASWQKYVTPSGDGQRKARSLKAILESLVVRHQIQDIEADIHLPPLYNRVVYLQPSLQDKLSVNLFVMTLTANAVTSERVDEDYMFHPKNRPQLNQLITNLRQSCFFWTGFSRQDVVQTLDVGHKYLEENTWSFAVERREDRVLLEQAMAAGATALNSSSWTAFAELHELGIFVEDFPLEARNAWSLVHRQTEDQPLVVGATQLSQAQKHINSHLYALNPADGLAQLGSSLMERAWKDVQKAASAAKEDADSSKANVSPSKSKKAPGASHSSLVEHPKLRKKSTISKAKVAISNSTSDRLLNDKQMGNIDDNSPSTGLKSALKSYSESDSVDVLPLDSVLSKTRLSGTASAKLSYLLDQVITLQQDEKILIFYEGDHIAYYIAQAFELLDIRFLIYTGALPVLRSNAYITTFNTTETFRVMLMNVHQAAHGLHIARASRVFFVNPVWQPNVEAQAIKRAHRIGQTRPVYVETLVLEGTLEDQMLKRRKGMNAQEHQQAEKSLLDDPIMGQIIRDARTIPLSEEETHNVRCQIANLTTPQQVFGRVTKGTTDSEDPDADLVFPEGHSSKPRNSRKRKTGTEPSRGVTSQRRKTTASASSSSIFSSVDELPSPVASSSRQKNSTTDHGGDVTMAPEPRPGKRVGFALAEDDEDGSAS